MIAEPLPDLHRREAQAPGTAPTPLELGRAKYFEDIAAAPVLLSGRSLQGRHLLACQMRERFRHEKRSEVYPQRPGQSE